MWDDDVARGREISIPLQLCAALDLRICGKVGPRVHVGGRSDAIERLSGEKVRD
jgi:hypothetical protein